MTSPGDLLRLGEARHLECATRERMWAGALRSPTAIRATPARHTTLEPAFVPLGADRPDARLTRRAEAADRPTD
jgi:hypothetical protein